MDRQQSRATPFPNDAELSTNNTSVVPSAASEEDDEMSYASSLNSVNLSFERQKSMGDISTGNSPDTDEIAPNTSSKVINSCSEGIRRFLAHWRILLLGQCLSVLLSCSSSLSASMHFNCNVSAPTFQTALVFGLMSFHCFFLRRKKTDDHSGIEREKQSFQENANTNANENVNDLALGAAVSIDSIDIKQHSKIQLDPTTGHRIKSPHSMCWKLLPLNFPWWAYASFAVISVEASFITYLAYRYTTLPSASLLDNVNIIAAMVGSRLILKRRYGVTHVLGAFICCIGVFINLASDLKKAGEDVTLIDDFAEQVEVVEYPRRLLGDILAILGGMMVGFCDVLIEMVLKDFVPVHEYLGCVGILGFIIAATQAFLLERDQIAKIFAAGDDSDSSTMTTKEIYETFVDNPFDAPRSCTQATATALVLGYAFSTYLFNFFMARFLIQSESALLTLSLLTADLYSVIFTVFAEHIPPSTMFYIAFVLVILGVVVYEMAPSPLGLAEDLGMERGIEIEKLHGGDVEMNESLSNLSWGPSMSFSKMQEVQKEGADEISDKEEQRREIL